MKSIIMMPPRLRSLSCLAIVTAASRLVTKDQVDRMLKSGVEVVSSGANVPFADKEIFYGPIGEYVDKNTSLIPDFISNCGMARVFAYLMQPDAIVEDEAIFMDTSKTIKDALEATFKANPAKKNIAETAFAIALDKLV